MDPQTRRTVMLEKSAQDPLDNVHPDGGMVEVRFMDDEIVACDPTLVCPSHDAVDIECQDPKKEAYATARRPMSS